MTHIPTYKDQHRIYGKTGKQSLWNNLPITPVECMGGVAYISLEHIVKFMFAHGICVDDIFVQVHETEAAEFSSSRVEHVEQCRRVMEWKHSVAGKLQNIDGGASVRKCLVGWTTMWKDGFGHS